MRSGCRAYCNARCLTRGLRTHRHGDAACSAVTSATAARGACCGFAACSAASTCFMGRHVWDEGRAYRLRAFAVMAEARPCWASISIFSRIYRASGAPACLAVMGPIAGWHSPARGMELNDAAQVEGGICFACATCAGAFVGTAKTMDCADLLAVGLLVGRRRTGTAGARALPVNISCSSTWREADPPLPWCMHYLRGLLGSRACLCACARVCVYVHMPLCVRAFGCLWYPLGGRPPFYGSAYQCI